MIVILKIYSEKLIRKNHRFYQLYQDKLYKPIK